jgi:ElaA protein
MILHWRAFSELSAAELYAALRLRAEVFVVEQNCVFQDLDGQDPGCEHLLDYEGEALVGYLRLMPPGLKYDLPSIGRVVTAKSARGTGRGKLLFAEGVRRLREKYPGREARISAQAYLRSFYEAFGFAIDGAEYLDDGIPHVDMLLPAGDQVP